MACLLLSIAFINKVEVVSSGTGVVGSKTLTSLSSVILDVSAAFFFSVSAEVVESFLLAVFSVGAESFFLAAFGDFIFGGTYFARQKKTILKIHFNYCSSISH